jgi:hypothetical protein
VLADEVRRAKPPLAPLGLSRAKLYAFHAAIATGVATGACGSSGTIANDAGSAMDARSGDATNGTDATSGDAESADAAESGGQDGSGDTSTVADAGTDQGIADTGADGDRWGPPPPPYGCVFPTGRRCRHRSGDR